MATINSVLGPIDTADLGFTLSHEHVLESSAGMRHVYPEFIDRQTVIKDGIALFSVAHTEGVRTMIDVTTLDLGRDIEVMKQVSRGSRVQLICATGFWIDIPRAVWYASPDRIAALFIREIEEGIEDTGVRAGVIKVATDESGATPEVESVLRAGARTHNATNVPISTHTFATGKVGDDQLNIFIEEGVDPSRVCIGHCDGTDDLDYVKGLADRGAWIGFDGLRLTAGWHGALPNFQQCVENIKKLLDAGYADRIMLSQDWAIMAEMFPNRMASRDELVKRNPDGHLTVTRKVLPLLREMGATDAQISQMTVENPRKFFEG